MHFASRSSLFTILTWGCVLFLFTVILRQYYHCIVCNSLTVSSSDGKTLGRFHAQIALHVPVSDTFAVVSGDGKIALAVGGQDKLVKIVQGEEGQLWVDPYGRIRSLLAPWLGTAKSRIGKRCHDPAVVCCLVRVWDSTNGKTIGDRNRAVER